MTIAVNEQIHLTDFRASDKPALVEHLNDRNVYERTLRIPFPYSEADADAWLDLIAKLAAQGRCFNWAIRQADGFLIGGCGFEGLDPGKTHRCEIGYWLATPFWGRGIMTAVVGRLCQHAFENLGTSKITAHVFAHNPASARVLEKCDFREEGFLRRHYFKDDQFIDARLFAKLAPDVS